MSCMHAAPRWALNTGACRKELMSGHGKQMILHCIAFIIVEPIFNKIRGIRITNNPGIALVGKHLWL